MTTDNDMEMREFDHFSIVPFKAICGADVPNQSTTQTPERAKCTTCWYYFKKWESSRTSTPTAAVPLDARERAREVTEEYRKQCGYAVLAKQDYLDALIAAALSSTPGVGDAIACVERLRDKWADDATAKGRAFSDKATTAEQIIAALEALQPSTPSEKEND